MLMCIEFYRAITNDVAEEFLVAGMCVDGIQLGEEEEVYIQYAWCNTNCAYVYEKITLHVYKPKVNSGKLDSLKKKKTTHFICALLKIFQEFLKPT